MMLPNFVHNVKNTKWTSILSCYNSRKVGCRYISRLVGFRQSNPYVNFMKIIAGVTLLLLVCAEARMAKNVSKL